MPQGTSTLAAFVCIATVVGCFASNSFADIAGFGDFSAFSINKSDGASSPVPDELTGSILLTGTTTNESRSIFAEARQSIDEFTASFTYRAAGPPNPATAGGFGATFILQNSAFGAETVAPWNTGPTFGYGGTFVPFANSIAVSLEFGQPGAGTSASGVYTGGLVTGGSTSMSVDLYSGNPIGVVITYNGTLLKVEISDALAGTSFTQSAALDIAAEVGDSLAYVGFAANTGNNTTASSEFSNFRFTSSVPAPSAVSLLGLAGVCCVRRRRPRY